MKQIYFFNLLHKILVNQCTNIKRDETNRMNIINTILNNR